MGNIISIPKEWNKIELKELIDSKRSIRYGIVQPGEFDKDGRYMVRGQDYSFGWVQPENLFRVSDEIESRYKNARLKSGDIILTIVGAGTGTVAIVPDWLNGANCTQTTARIAIDPAKADNQFIYHFLNSYNGKKLTHQNIKGGAQPGLNCGDIEYFEIILPPLPEQKAIAQLLSTWDKAIHKTEQLITQKEQHKKWLMQNLLTGKMRLKGFSGEWKEVRISDCLSRMVNGITYDTEKKDGVPVTRIETISDGIINFNKIGFADMTKNIEDYRLHKGDILYSHINSLAHIGKVAIYHAERPLYHGMNLLLLRCNEFTNTGFLYQWLVSENGRKKAIILAKPAVNQASISTTELKKILIHLPTFEEQTAIAQVLQAADKEISLLKAKAEKLREQKKGLMQVLLTGKLRLKLDN